MKPTVTSTLSLIKKAHSGQKYGNSPYWTHPLAVAEKGREIFRSEFVDTVYMASLLHDVVEDTDLTLTDLQNLGYSAEIVDVVELVTKDNFLNYEGNIRRITQSGNRAAMMVKFADNLVNYSADNSHWDAKRAAKSQEKYMKSMQTIGKVLGVNPETYL